VRDARGSTSAGDRTTESLQASDATVHDFAEFWARLADQAKAHDLSKTSWAARASKLAGRREQTGKPEHKPFSAKTLYDRAQHGRRVEWNEAQWFVRAIPHTDISRWQAAWERAEQRWLATYGESASTRSVDLQFPSASAQPGPANPHEANATSTPSPIARWRWRIILSGVAVLALLGAVLWKPVASTAPEFAAPPVQSLPLSATAPAEPSTFSSSAGPAGVRHMVCADSLSVLRDPQPKNETEVLASLRWGDNFYVQRTRGPAWSYGVSVGSLEVEGWVLTNWLKTAC
jgi:hypothetical protein